MKRFLLFSLVTALLLSSSTSFAATQTFTRFSCNVPAGWTAVENDAGSIVRFTKDSDSSKIVYVQMVKNTLSLDDTANQICNTFNGTGLAMNSSNVYHFIFQLDGAETHGFVYGRQSRSSFPEGVYCFLSTSGTIVMTGDTITAMDQGVSTINGSITANTSWANGGSSNDDGGNSNDDNNTTTTLEGTVQTFTRLSVKVPDGWTGSESDSGATVYITNNADSSMRFSIQVVNMLGRTLKAMADEAYSTYGGTGEIAYGSSSSEFAGVYMFTVSRGGNVLVFDNQYATGLMEGYCSLIYATPMSVDIEVIKMILKSVTVNEDWVYNKGSDQDSTDGTTQTFTQMTIKIPSGWTATENNAGDIVYIDRESPRSRIAVQLIDMEGLTLQEIVDDAFDNLNGTGEIQQQGEVYMFQTEDDAAVFMFDHNTSKLVEGFCCLMYITGQNPGADLTTVQNSITINESWLNSRNNDNNDSRDPKGFLLIDIFALTDHIGIDIFGNCRCCNQKLGVCC